MKNQILSLVLVLSCLVSCKQKAKQSKQHEEDALQTKIDSALQRAAAQYTFMSENTPLGKYPKTYYETTDTYETSNSDWWCSGFYPGTLLYLYEAIQAPALKEKAIATFDDLQKEQFNTTTHDLGFMMYCSFGNAERLEKKESYEAVLMNSAKSLAARYNDKAKAIKSWDSAPWNKAGEGEMAVIIDNMMNLELLFWATEFSKDSTYYNIAVNHANTTIKNHFRPDFSSYHQVTYDETTGAVKAQITNQGYADSSSWARGQAWALYGYTVMYRFTKEEQYLQQAQGIADYVLAHPNLPADKIPYWDFDAPDIPNALRDSSAAAVMASALLELGTFANGKTATTYTTAATTMLQTLLTPTYLATAGTNGGFILKHGVGNMPNNTEIDTPLTYGDYYFIEALVRYQQLEK